MAATDDERINDPLSSRNDISESSINNSNVPNAVEKEEVLTETSQKQATIGEEDKEMESPVSTDNNPLQSPRSTLETKSCSTATDSHSEELKTDTLIISNKIEGSTNSDSLKLKFIFANRDGLNVNVDCNLTDTVGEVKGILFSVWPKDLPDCCDSERIRLICMGKGVLMPDSRTLSDCQVPVFPSHATPINVSIKPVLPSDFDMASKSKKESASANDNRHPDTTQQGCACTIL